MWQTAESSCSVSSDSWFWQGLSSPFTIQNNTIMSARISSSGSGLLPLLQCNTTQFCQLGFLVLAGAFFSFYNTIQDNSVSSDSLFWQWPSSPFTIQYNTRQFCQLGFLVLAVAFCPFYNTIQYNTIMLARIPCSGSGLLPLLQYNTILSAQIPSSGRGHLLLLQCNTTQFCRLRFLVLAVAISIFTPQWWAVSSVSRHHCLGIIFDKVTRHGRAGTRPTGTQNRYMCALQACIMSI